MSVVCLPIPMIRPVGCKDNVYKRILTEMGVKCDRAKNATLWHWQQWAREAINCDAEKYVPDKEVSNLYALAREAAPGMMANNASMCQQKAIKWLGQKTPWTHRKEGGSDRNWQALLNYELSAPSYRSRLIEMHYRHFKILHNVHGYVLQASLYSKDAGRLKRSITVELDRGGLSKGHCHLLDKALLGELKIGCAGIAPTAPGRWRLLLPLTMNDASCGLDQSRSMEIKMSPANCNRPFTVTTPDGIVYRSGAGLALKQIFGRLEIRSRVLRSKKRGLRKGHGNTRAWRDIKPIARDRQGLLRNFRISIAKDVVGLCKKHNCGSLTIIEPHLYERRDDWFGRHNMTFDWTLFIATMKSVVGKTGIKVKVAGRKDGKKKKKAAPSEGDLVAV